LEKSIFGDSLVISTKNENKDSYVESTFILKYLNLTYEVLNIKSEWKLGHLN